MSTGPARRARERASESETIFSAKNIHCAEILLNVKLMFTSQHVVHIFYESRNCKGITACNCLNINRLSDAS